VCACACARPVQQRVFVSSCLAYFDSKQYTALDFMSVLLKRFSDNRPGYTTISLVVGSNLGANTSYPGWGSSWFSLFLRANSGTVLRPLLSISCPHFRRLLTISHSPRDPIPSKMALIPFMRTSCCYLLGIEIENRHFTRLELLHGSKFEANFVTFTLRRGRVRRHTDTRTECMVMSWGYFFLEEERNKGKPVTIEARKY
jgi:hypothetical protein